MKTLCFGSLNLDMVYHVEHIAREGETIHSTGFAQHLGGKGFNQSIALKRAGLTVSHAGLIGADGHALKAYLSENGVDTRFVCQVNAPTGHALIQVDEQGRNCILLNSGANMLMTPDFVNEVLAAFDRDDLLVLQNEINELNRIIRSAKAKGMRIVLNPSPISQDLFKVDLALVDIFIMNETEGNQLTGESDPQAILNAMHKTYPNAAVVLTLGEQGAWYSDLSTRCHTPAVPANAVDTTAAGDTFTGFFLAACFSQHTKQSALALAARAAAVTVSRPGAAGSIPHIQEL